MYFYLFQPINLKLQYYTDTSEGNSEKRKDAVAKWNADRCKMQDVLRASASEAHKKGQISAERKHTYFSSG